MCLIPPSSSLVWGSWLHLGSGTAELESCCYFILSPSGQGGGTDGAGVAWGGFFPGCQVKQVGSDSHLMLQPFTATLAT